MFLIIIVIILNVQQVKQIMEEAVTRKFVHEESGSITSLCGIVYMYYSFNCIIKLFIAFIEVWTFK